MEYTNVTNPTWANAEHTIINCNVDFDGIGIVPFTANPSDESNPSSLQIFNECICGKYGNILEYIPPKPYIPSAQDNKLTAVGMLDATDWATASKLTDPIKCNPVLDNQNDFFEFQNKVRAIALNPTDGVIEWPSYPTAIWKEI